MIKGKKIDSMLCQHSWPFVLCVGTRKQVKRKVFDACIGSNLITRNA